MFTEENAITLNRKFSNGAVRNKSSLQFALSSIKNKSSIDQLAYLTRSIIVDHVFEDGNKRTAALLIVAYFTEFEIGFDRSKAAKLVLDIAAKNITDIRKIKRMIKDVIR